MMLGRFVDLMWDGAESGFARRLRNPRQYNSASLLVQFQAVSLCHRLCETFCIRDSKDAAHMNVRRLALDDELHRAVAIHFGHGLGQRQVIDVYQPLLPRGELLQLWAVQHGWRTSCEDNALAGDKRDR